jgi:hypothetical protein
MTLYKNHKFADASISDLSQKSKEFFFLRIARKCWGAGPLIGLDRFSTKNGPDLSQYATL